MSNRVRLKANIVVLVCMFVLLSACFRVDVDDPGMHKNAGFRITLAGTASPSTLYMPSITHSVSTDLSVKATNNDGSPVSGKDVIFQIIGVIGNLENYKNTILKTTNADGYAGTRFFIPAGTQILSETTIHVKAVLVDDGRQDSSLSEVVDTIPIKVIPNTDLGGGSPQLVTLQGRVTSVSGNGLSGVVLSFTSTAKENGVAVTSAGGSWSISLPSGWYGDITPYRDGVTFQPPKYSFSSANPILLDVSGLDFVGVGSAGDTLSVDRSSLNVTSSPGTYTINVFNSSSDKPLEYYIVSNNPWLTVSKSSGTTDDTFTITVAQNQTGSARTGSVRLTAVDSSVGGSPITINVSQEPEGGGTATLKTDFIQLDVNGAQSTHTVNVFNSSSTLAIEYYIVSNDPWLNVSKSSGTTDDNFDLTIAKNETGLQRTGTVTITAKESSVSGSPITITVVQQAGSGISTLTADVITLNVDDDPIADDGTVPSTYFGIYEVNVYNSTSSAVINYVITRLNNDGTSIPEDGWIQVKNADGDNIQDGDTTVRTIRIYIRDNGSGDPARTGRVVITATTPDVLGTPLTITINQKVGDGP